MNYRHYTAVRLPSGRYVARSVEYPHVYSIETFASVAEVRQYETNTNFGVKRGDARKKGVTKKVDIIYCKDCMHYNPENGDCEELPKLVGDMDYCSFAKRRANKQP